ncbi:hypothetical protein CR513_61078, partial [Mucuna pruriens]
MSKRLALEAIEAGTRSSGIAHGKSVIFALDIPMGEGSIWIKLRKIVTCGVLGPLALLRSLDLGSQDPCQTNKVLVQQTLDEPRLEDRRVKQLRGKENMLVKTSGEAHWGIRDLELAVAPFIERVMRLSRLNVIAGVDEQERENI